jgi:hypothetical protein
LPLAEMPSASMAPGLRLQAHFSTFQPAAFQTIYPETTPV